MLLTVWPGTSTHWPLPWTWGAGAPGPESRMAGWAAERAGQDRRKRAVAAGRVDDLGRRVGIGGRRIRVIGSGEGGA